MIPDLQTWIGLDFQKNNFKIMKKWILCATLFFLFSNANAQAKISSVADAAESLRVAMIDADVKMLSFLTNDSLSYGHSSGKIQNKSQFIQSISSGESDFVSINITNQRIQYFGNTAIIRHTLSAVTNDNNKPGTVKLDIILVWIKQHRTWKLIARQAVKSPQ